MQITKSFLLLQPELSNIIHVYYCPCHIFMLVYQLTGGRLQVSHGLRLFEYFIFSLFYKNQLKRKNTNMNNLRKLLSIPITAIFLYLSQTIICLFGKEKNTKNVEGMLGIESFKRLQRFKRNCEQELVSYFLLLLKRGDLNLTFRHVLGAHYVNKQKTPCTRLSLKGRRKRNETFFFKDR